MGRFIVFVFVMIWSLSSQALVTTPAEVLFFDMTQGIECTVSYGRATSKIIVSDFTDYESRLLYLVGNSGRIERSVQAKCDFSEDQYVCRWGAVRSIRINLYDVFQSEMGAKKTAHLNGRARLDLFRPPIQISCPIELNGQIKE